MSGSLSAGTATSALGVGIALHLLVFKNIELEVYLPPFVGVSLLSFGGLIYHHVFFDNGSTITSLSRGLSEVLCVALGIFCSMAVYRIFFHSIRKVPGPFWAGLTRFYALYLSAKNVQYHVEITKMHEKYGDFIRTGPREICILRKSAVPQIYGPKSACSKSTFFNQVSSKSSKASLFFVRDSLQHKRRRRAWERGLNVKSIAIYQSRIKSKVDLLISKLQEQAGAPQNATALTMMLAFDIMGEVGFGSDFGAIASGKEPAAAKAIHDHMTILGIMDMTPWLLYILQYVPGASAGYAPFFKWCTNTIDKKRAQWSPEKTPQDVSSWLIKATMEKDTSAPPTERALHDDARLIIIAGSDTSASANACTLFFLARHPHVLEKLQRKLDEAMPQGTQEWSYDTLASVPYLDDVIQESLRLKPPVITGTYRTTPPEGMQVDEVYIPGGINVFTPFEMMQTDERYWPEAKEFIPERWGERREEMGTDDAPFLAFSAGTYKCPGDRLAMMSMRIAISSIVQNFDIRFAPGETGQAFQNDRKDVFTTVLQPLNICFLPRNREKAEGVTSTS